MAQQLFCFILDQYEFPEILCYWRKYGLVCSIELIKTELSSCATGFKATPSIPHMSDTEGRINVYQLSLKLYEPVFSFTEKCQIHEVI